MKMVSKSKYILFCMLNVVNPMTTGPKAKKLTLILSKLPDHTPFNTLLITTVNLLYPCQKQGSKKNIRPNKNPKGANTM
jgi:hypothetical protein